MIKRGQTRHKLLRKMSEESYQDEIPFDIESEYCPSEIPQEDRSYILLNQDHTSNPYSIEENQKPKYCRKTYNKIPQPDSIKMNGVSFKKVVETPHNFITQEKKVQCDGCAIHQLIPVYSLKFYCYSCSKLCVCPSSYENSIKSEPKKNLKQQVQIEMTNKQPKKEALREEKIEKGQVGKTQHKLFICGTCQAKVCYVPGLSQYYMCSKCRTINKVPE